MGEEKNPLVVFYDCCVPKDPFRKIVPKLVRFADHIFLHNGHTSDYDLLTCVEKIREEKYDGKPCFFMTFDQTFKDDAAGHPALDNTVHIITLAPSNTCSLNLQRAREASKQLLDLYFDIICHNRRYTAV